MRLKVWHCLALLTLVVLLAYSPSLQAGFNTADDEKMVNRIAAAGPIDLEKHFFPHNKRYYYRPLTTLTYHLDRDLMDSAPSFMHLVNILLHLGSTLLVFAVGLRVARVCSIESLVTPLLGSLLFALHPLAAESVCWVSGRTDLLCGFFLLLSLWLLLTGLTKRQPLATVLCGVTLLAACLAKEVAVFVLPAMLWLVLFFDGNSELRVWARLRHRWFSLILPIAAVVGYFWMRQLASSRDTGIKTAIKGVVASDYDLFDKARIALKVYGFYFKKLFVPWPLNFAIVEISGWYVLAGVILVGVLFWLAWRRDLLSSLCLMAFVVLSPALLVVLGKMTWTPLAERYLYIPVAFLAPAVAVWLCRWHTRQQARARKVGVLLLATLLLTFFSSTMHRAWTWSDNELLYRDTLAKSPGFVAAKAELASALLRKGKTAEAEAILEEMQVDDGPVDYINDNINLALIKFDKGELDASRKLLLPLLETKSKKHYDLLQHLLRINDQLIGKAVSQEQRLAIQQESVMWLEEQIRLKPRVFTLYRLGKMYYAMGDHVAALDSFRIVLEKAPADAYYRGAAATYVNKLEEGL